LSDRLGGTVTLNHPAHRALRVCLAIRPGTDNLHSFFSRFRQGFGTWGVEGPVVNYRKLAKTDGTQSI